MEKAAVSHFGDEPEVPISVPDLSSNRSGHFNRFFSTSSFFESCRNVRREEADLADLQAVRWRVSETNEVPNKLS